MTLQEKQAAMRASHSKARPKLSFRARELRRIIKDPATTNTDKVKAMALLDRIEQRVVKKREAAAKLVEPDTDVAPEPPAEDVEAALAELQERIDASEKLAVAFRAKRREWFNEHPDRAGEIMAAIGSAEFVRLTE